MAMRKYVDIEFLLAAMQNGMLDPFVDVEWFTLSAPIDAQLE